MEHNQRQRRVIREDAEEHTHTLVWHGDEWEITHIHLPIENGNIHPYAHCYRGTQLSPPHSWEGPVHGAGTGFEPVSAVVNGKPSALFTGQTARVKIEHPRLPEATRFKTNLTEAHRGMLVSFASYPTASEISRLVRVTREAVRQMLLHYALPASLHPAMAREARRGNALQSLTEAQRATLLLFTFAPYMTASEISRWVGVTREAVRQTRLRYAPDMKIQRYRPVKARARCPGCGKELGRLADSPVTRDVICRECQLRTEVVECVLCGTKVERSTIWRRQLTRQRLKVGSRRSRVLCGGQVCLALQTVNCPDCGKQLETTVHQRYMIRKRGQTTMRCPSCLLAWQRQRTRNSLGQLDKIVSSVSTANITRGSAR